MALLKRLLSEAGLQINVEGLIGQSLALSPLAVWQKNMGGGRESNKS